MLRAPKTKHIKQDLPDNGQILNKRRSKHIKQGLFTKVSATLCNVLAPLNGSCFMHYSPT